MVDKKTGGSAEIINIETIDTENADYAEVVKLFDAYAIWALPVILIDGKVVSWGATRLDKIEAAVEGAIESPETINSQSN